MALIKCPECGMDVSDKAKNCIHCGYPIAKNHVDAQKIITIAKSNKKWIIIAAVIFAVVIALCLGGSSMSKDEKIAYEAAVELKSMLKDPDSFKLYDEILFLKRNMGDEKPASFYIIMKYGGANSYGATITRQAIFLDGKYLIDYEDELEGSVDDDGYLEKAAAKAIIDYWMVVGDGTNYQSYVISTEKIKDKMGLK